MKKILFIAVLALLFSCKKTTPPTVLVQPKVYSFDTGQNSSLMFQDGESLAVYTSEARRLKISSVLSIKAATEKSIEISNFAPVDLEDAIVLITIKGREKPIQLLKIKKIRAHGTQIINYPFVDGESNFIDINGNVVDLSEYKTTGIPVADVQFDFSGENTLIKKLKKLSVLKWDVRFADFDTDNNPNDSWKEDLTPADVRLFTGLLINYAYLMQDEGTKKEFLAEPISINDDAEFLTLDEKQSTYQDILNINRINAGVVVGVNGLGGGSTFGMAEWVLRTYLKEDISAVAVHELGHVVGYAHSSSMTYPRNGHGFMVACSRNYEKIANANEFPITKDNYYKPADFID